MTKKEVIKLVQANVTQLYPVGDGFSFNSRDPGLWLWYQHVPQQYQAAKNHRSQMMIDLARSALGLETLQYDGGPWTDYLDT